MAFGSGSPEAGTSSDAAVANITFSATDELSVNYTCVLSVADGAAAQGTVYYGEVNPAAWALGTQAACASPAVFHWLLPGQWTLNVTATDAAGNQVCSQVWGPEEGGREGKGQHSWAWA